MTTIPKVRKVRLVPSRLYSVPEAADWLGVVDEVIRRYLRSGRLEGYKRRVQGLKLEWRIKGSHIHAFLNLSEETGSSLETRKSGKRTMKDFVAEIQKLFADVPQADRDRLPEDWAHNIDHYLYGAPKR